MTEVTESHPPATRGRPWIAGLTMAALAAVCAVISYNDGLLLIHLYGAKGRVAYLYPLLPDGLVIISTAAMYEAARAGISRPRWAIAGITLGAVLTIAMNAAAGAVQSWLFALADLFVPVVFFVALEVLIWLIRRGRGGSFPIATGAAPATSGPCPHTVALTREDAVRAAYGHARDCLDEPVSIRQLAATFKMHRDRVAELARPAPAGGAQDGRGGGAAPEAGGTSASHDRGQGGAACKHPAAALATPERGRGAGFPPGPNLGAPPAQDPPAGAVGPSQAAPAGANGQARA